MAKDEEKLRAKEARTRAKAARAQAKAEEKRMKAEVKKARVAPSPPPAGHSPVVIIPTVEKKPWWKRFVQEHLVQVIVKVVAGLIVAYLVWRFGIKR